MNNVKIKRYKFPLLWLAFCIGPLGLISIFILNLPVSLLARFSLYARKLSGRITVMGVKWLKFFQPWWVGEFKLTFPEEVVQYKKGALFVANHRSHLDVFLLLELIPGVRVLTKNLIFWIPGLGQAAWLLRMVYIKRGRSESYWKAMEDIRQGLEMKDRMLVFPEMTRSPFGQTKLSRFTLGPFQKAIQTRSPIIPVVIWGSDYLWPKEELAIAKKAPLIIESLPAVDSSQYSSAEKLSQYVSDQIQKRILQLSQSHSYETF
jgi:1-acyl-sn-glycerol-3-phosphate acyltransferase